MSHRLLSLVAIASLAAGCARSDSGGDLVVAAEEIPSPAGPFSGEPFVASEGGIVFMSWLEQSGEGHDLRFARFDGTGWTSPHTIAHSEDFFVNWADFPSVRPGPGGTLWAHWLERGAAGGYDYGVRIVRSDDGGETWSEAWTPHDDDSPTEHGFVSAFRDGDGLGFVWLDGRKNDPEVLAASGGHGEMTLRHRVVAADGTPDEEILLDGRVCDCCQTASTMTDDGPIVVYRNRTDDEIRDIYVTRRVDGVWTEGAPVHDDGWEIGGCPVNGPAIDASGSHVAVAWFTGAGNEGRVKLSFSHDAGATFGAPIVVDDGMPGGRVDVRMLDDGAALVTWLEHTSGDAAEVRLRIVGPDGDASESHALTRTTSGRPSGFPRVAPMDEGTFLLAWTDATSEEPRVRVQQVEMVR
jgi:hypothetical protein